MSWQKEVDGINARRDAAKELGGEEAIARQHDQGRLTVRERISRVADPQTDGGARHGGQAGRPGRQSVIAGRQAPQGEAATGVGESVCGCLQSGVAFPRVACRG